MSHDQSGALRRTFIYGVLSIALYFSLYLFADPILELSRQGRWYFIVPIVIAFLFSVIHGNFTGQFWDLFGVKAKQAKK
jgi:hypothetical protein